MYIILYIKLQTICHGLKEMFRLWENETSQKTVASSQKCRIKKISNIIVSTNMPFLNKVATYRLILLKIPRLTTEQ